MSDEQLKRERLVSWRAKRRLKRHRTVMEKLFGAVDGDSEEKTVQRHTSRGDALEAEDRARLIKGSGGGLM
ncbi:MAG: hypothetical protein QOJ21_2404 [Solirubrobacteraceae bacterium]|nr:hypothetical protein [Solirubrobacteraceae bacterium]